VETEKNFSPAILALIPAYNEGPTIQQVVKQVSAFLPVLVVDDGSRDDTAQQAAQGGAVVIEQKPNQGKGVALRTGFLYAIEQHYSVVITLDGDGQHDPAEIPAFLDRYKNFPSDLLIGARTFQQMPPVRRMANTLGRSLFSWALRQPVMDNQSGYRLISRRMMEAMLTCGECGFEFEVDMLVVCVERGFQLDWTPIRTIYGDQGSHISPLKHAFHFFRMVLQTRRRTKPNRR
jgi:glycosyltransferase involved in cell wall biosynthesis